MKTLLFVPVFACLVASQLAAQGVPARPDTVPRPKPDTVAQMAPLEVRAKPEFKPVDRGADTTKIRLLQRLTLPVTMSVTAGRAAETVNAVDPEDVVKYLPSIFIRKRNYGDYQATIETRVWGVGSSARSLVFADGVPLTALIGNNNTIGAPRWGLVTPEQIDRVDVMYGPFSAAYAGNSMGGVMEITTHMPDKFEGTIGQTVAMQSFNLYGTSATYPTSVTAVGIGDRFGKFSFWANANYQQSRSQPLSYATGTTFPGGTSGGFAAQNKLGANANILGATGLLRTGMTNLTGKIAYDFTPALRATYTLGFWQNRTSAFDESYLTSTSNSQPTYAGVAGFASGYYHFVEQHTSQSLSLRTTSQGDWDFDVTGTLYNFGTDQQRTPSTAAATGTTFGTAGKVAVLDGTGWATADLKASWHPGGVAARNVVSFGVHDDYYHLFNPTYNTSDWVNGDDGTVASEGDGKTTTQALWAQDMLRITPMLKLTVGGRLEHFRAFDGYNANGTTVVNQPEIKATKFSPKGSLAWTPTSEWEVTGSIGKAYRFATASELYQLVTTGTTFTAPDPNLKPDNDVSAELRIDRQIGDDGHARVSLFEDDVKDAIISQFLPLVPGSATLYSYLSNVDHVRAKGFEAALDGNHVLLYGLQLSGSVTYVDARTLVLAGQASATATPGSSIGKRLPNIPDWRASMVATYHPSTRLALSYALRYSGDVFTTLDNSDVNPNTYQGFSSWLVSDIRANYHGGEKWEASVGVDNLFNRKYFFFHPFPQRTLVGSVKYSF